MSRFLGTILTLLLFFPLHSQDKLTWDAALEIALDKNFGIRLLKQDVTIAENLNHAGNAGYLPTLDVGASQNWTSNDVRLEFFSGDVNEVDGAQSTSNNAFVELNWTFFDGFKMFARDGLLDQREELASVMLQAEMGAIIHELLLIYLRGIKLQRELSILQKNFELSEFRYNFLKNKVLAGAGSKTELIQAELDKNNDRAQIIRKENELVQNKFDLIQLMGFEQSDLFYYDSAFAMLEPLNYADAATRLDSLNQDLLMARMRVAESRYEKKIAQADFYPQFSVNTAYDFSNSTSEAGVLSSNRSLGPSFTLNLRWNVFGSFNRIRNLKNTEININSAKIFEEQIKFTKETELKKYYETYARVTKIAEIDQQNLSSVEDQIEIAESAFKNGQIDALELRVIQFSVQQIKLNQAESKMQLGMVKANIGYLSGGFQQLINP